MKLSEQELYQEYPLLYADHNKPPTETGMCWGIQCESGWWSLIERASERLESYIWEHFRDDPDHPRAYSVKQKFGRLEIYLTYYDSTLQKIVDDARTESLRTCEVTGKPGKLRMDLGWIRTLCDEEYEKAIQKARAFL